MCDILDLSGSHGIANLHVCVDLIVSPSVRLIAKGFVAGEISVTGVLGSTKWPVAPASAIAMPTAVLIFDVLNRASAWGVCSKFYFWIVYFQIICLDSNGLVVVSMGGASLSIDVLSVSTDVSLVILSNWFEQLLIGMVSSSISFSL